MFKVNRFEQILKIMEDIEQSSLSVNQYFKEKKAPFGYRQYYNYKKIIKEQGIEGLNDRRIKGNHQKITEEIKNYILGLVDNKRDVTSIEIRV